MHLNRYSLIRAALLITIATCTSTTLHAGVGDQLFKLVSEDITSGDRFSEDHQGVAVHGTTAIIGARRNDDQGGESGSAYLFDVRTGQQLRKLLPDEGEPGGWFGSSVDIHEDRAVIGSVGVNSDGAAFLFDASTGEQLFELLPDPDVSPDKASFGAAVAISGHWAIIGAPYDTERGEDSGAAYIFDLDTGERHLKLFGNPDVGPEGEFGQNFFGYAVAIHGNTAIVGARKEDINGTSSGSAYIFDAITGEQQHLLLAGEDQIFDGFGFAVDINEQYALVGAAVAEDLSGGRTVSAHLYDVNSGNLIVKLTPDDPSFRIGFGTSVSMHGDFAVVGAWSDDVTGTNSGSAYLFEIPSGRQLAKLTPSDGAIFDEFGKDVAITDGFVVAGAYQNNEFGPRAGAAYVFSTVPEPSTLGGVVIFLVLVARPQRLFVQRR